MPMIQQNHSSPFTLKTAWKKTSREEKAKFFKAGPLSLLTHRKRPQSNCPGFIGGEKDK